MSGLSSASVNSLSPSTPAAPLDVSICLSPPALGRSPAGRRPPPRLLCGVPSCNTSERSEHNSFNVDEGGSRPPEAVQPRFLVVPGKEMRESERRKCNRQQEKRNKSTPHWPSIQFPIRVCRTAVRIVRVGPPGTLSLRGLAPVFFACTQAVHTRKTARRVINFSDSGSHVNGQVSKQDRWR